MILIKFKQDVPFEMVKYMTEQMQTPTIVKGNDSVMFLSEQDPFSFAYSLDHLMSYLNYQIETINGEPFNKINNNNENEQRTETNNIDKQVSDESNQGNRVRNKRVRKSK